MNIAVAKAGTTYEFDIESLPAESIKYLIGYGLKQSMNDVVAAVKNDTVAAREKADTRRNQIVSGNVPGSRAPADPKLAKVREMARAVEEAGFDITKVDPATLVEFLKEREEMGRAA